MNLLKKRDASPGRHIGMALVPPAAFTAVPHSPPPTPITEKKRKKNKIMTSPIIPSIIAANITAQSVAMGRLTTDLEDYFPGESHHFIDDSDTYAQIPLNKSRINTGSIEHDFEDADDFPDAGTSKSKAKNDKYAVPNKIKPGPSNLKRNNLRKSRKKAEEILLHAEVNEEQGQSNYPAVAEDLHNMHSFRGDSPESHIKTPRSLHVESPSLRGTSPANFGDANNDLEERMMLKDKEARAMIMELMNDKHNQSLSRSAPDVGSFDAQSTDNARKVVQLLTQDGFTGVEGVVLKDEIQSLVNENYILKDTVHRLNHELARYQEKSGEIPKDASTGLDNREAKWLTDVAHLSPLFLSYDQQLADKNGLIAKYQAQISDMREQVEEIIAENNVLHSATKQIRAEPMITQQKWDNIKLQNNLMVEEIQVLMQQLQLGKKAMKDMHISHVEEVSRLTNRLAVSQAEFQVEEKDGIKLKEELKSLKQQVDELKVECSEKITPHEHAHKVKRLQTDLELMQETSDKEIKSLTQKLKALQKEKSKLSMEVTELTAENEQLKGEIETMMQNRRRCQQEMDLLRSSLEESEQRELDCQLHLSNVVRLAERATTDRATFAAIAEREQKSAHTVLRDSMREKWEMGRMEESLRQCKVKLASQTDDVNNRLREVEETHIGHLNECERKMRHLQKLLQQKQQALDDMARNKQEIERDLENVWQAANSENRRLMEALCKS